MAKPNDQDSGDPGLVFAHNNHDERCGPPPQIRNTANRGLYYGYFENRHREQFVFTFDRATRTGTVSGGDLGWGDPRSFTLGQLDGSSATPGESLRRLAGQGQPETSEVPGIDAGMALGRFIGVTGKDEIIWLRACLEACVIFSESPRSHHSG